MTERDRLGGEDAAWLHMERTTNPMVVNGIMELAGRLAHDDAHALVERLAAPERFRSRVVERSLHVGTPSWERVADFDVRDHYEHVELAPGDEALRQWVGREVSALLDPSRPLWRVTFIDRPGAGTAVFFRVHHCIADGFGMLGVLAALCDEASIARPSVRPRDRRASPTKEQIVATARAVRHLVGLPADEKTLLKDPQGNEKVVAWSERIPLSDVKAATGLTGGTVNDVLVAVATGALRRYLARRGESVAALELHAMVPVNLRPPNEAATLGNRFGLVVLGLPIGIDDPVARVSAVHQRMEVLKGMPEAPIAHDLLRVAGWAPRTVEDAVVAYFAKKTSLVLTNVPGPRRPLRFGGIRVSRIIFFVPQAGRMGLGISIFSYAGEVTVGIIADAGLVPDPEALVRDLGEERAELDRLVRAELRAREIALRPAGATP